MTKTILAIRLKFHAEILAAARQAVEDGTPINRPLWWVDPTDPETFVIDSGKQTITNWYHNTPVPVISNLTNRILTLIIIKSNH
jgi:hypothetical protein